MELENRAKLGVRDLAAARDALTEARAEKAKLDAMTGPVTRAERARINAAKSGWTEEIAARDKRVEKLKASQLDANPSGLDLAAARQVAKAGLPKYGETMVKLIDYQNKLASYLRDSGVLSKDGYTAMVQANRLYIPFSRIMGDEATGTKFSRATLQARNPIERIEGSDRHIVDPLESIIRNSFLFVNMAEKNAAGLKLVDMLKRAAEGGTYERDLIPREVATKDGKPTPEQGKLGAPEQGKIGTEQRALPAPKGGEIAHADEAVRLPDTIDTAADRAITEHLREQGVEHASAEELTTIIRTRRGHGGGRQDYRAEGRQA